ncbi:hypothetical protein C4D60_Mb00t20030 [Musa balbisiana]|uniref:Uncharacterized protein n=1 Tax=Musa balbisiana TaxID=52838 RepID=A0A4S8I2P3_MUSBA|nr:hypothetical protein C4D60_Mb00t20030 [Musa balbisiana]
MGKIGFIVTLLSEIGLDYGFSHSPWFHKSPYDFPDLNRAETACSIRYCRKTDSGLLKIWAAEKTNSRWYRSPLLL